MKPGISLWSMAAVICGAALALAGCPDDGGDGPSQTEDAGMDGGGDVLPVDAEGDVTTCLGDDDCDQGLTCSDSNICVPASCQMDDECGPNKICREGVCDPGCREDNDCESGEVCNDQDECVAGQAQCTSPGDSCDPANSAPVGAGFQCVDTTGDGNHQCLTNCDITQQNPDADCSPESICLPVSNQMGAATACFPSNCDGATDDSACDDFQEHPFFGSYDNGGSCTRLRNNTRYCLPSGTQAEGSVCNENSPVLCDPDAASCNACATGTRCVDSVCRSVCGSGSDCSGTGCVGVDSDGIVGVDAGFCADSCEPFSRGECDSGEGCRLLTTSVGYCGPAGTKGFMESCTPPSNQNPDERECAEGMSCVVYQSGEQGVEIARCTPLCDAPDGDPTRANSATCGGQAYVRFAYVGSAPSAIDVYIDGLREFDDIATDSVTDSDGGAPGSQYTAYAAGQTQIQIVQGSASNNNSPLVDIPPIFVGGEATTWTAAPDGQGGIEMYMISNPRGISQPASNLTALRVAHTVPDLQDDIGNDIPVDVVVVSAGGDPSSGSASVVGNSLQPGDTGDFQTVTAEAVDVYVFATGSARNPGNEEALFEDVSLPGGERRSLYLRGTVDNTDAEPLGVALIDHTNPPPAPVRQCVNSSGGEVGLCFQDCAFDDYGEDTCFSDQNACRPFFDSTGHCLPHGEADGTVVSVGDACDPTDWGPCEEGAFCRRQGNGSGVCTAYCVGGGQYSALTCDSPRVCPAAEDSLGSCELPCTPNSNYGDPQTCPSFFQTCIPSNITDDTGMAEGAYCSSSGMRSAGATCGGMNSTSATVWQNCEPGSICAYGSGTAEDPFGGYVSRRTGQNAPDPTCRPTCDPFAQGGSSCADGQACAVNLAVATSAEVGVCLEEASVTSKQTGTSCAEEDLGKACGDGSICGISGGQRVCLEFCDWETQSGCSGNTSCQLPASNAPIGGVLGLCQ